MGIGRTRDDRFITIGVHSTRVLGRRYAPASDPTIFTVLAPRQRDVEYDADHYDGRWVIRTNDGAKNFAGHRTDRCHLACAMERLDRA